jgi:DNA-binding CsgD family transcriptional regulator
MWEQAAIEKKAPRVEPARVRVGDMKAILRVMRPLDGGIADPVLSSRRLVADLCRLVGVSVGAAIPHANGAGTSAPSVDSNLPPRLTQTLELLLNGASEKQVARQLNLSQHTVHGYVKALYRHFKVSTRSELLARHLNRPTIYT